MSHHYDKARVALAVVSSLRDGLYPVLSTEHRDALAYAKQILDDVLTAALSAAHNRKHGLDGQPVIARRLWLAVVSDKED